MISANLLFGLQLARSMHFTGQQLALPLFEKILTGKSKTLSESDKLMLKKASGYLLQLLRKDSENIQQGLYPVSVLAMENPWQHWRRFLSILGDGYKIAQRRQNKDAHDLPNESAEFLSEVPEYFKRNYHFQTGGYLTEGSAELYEHQVEILFSGAADAMRRLLIPLIKKQMHSPDGQGLRFLELGAGTGRLTRFMKLAFPKARIVCTDLSDPYLSKARKRLGEFQRIDFLQAAAEKLPFAEGEFDLVYSCFLFHELPQSIREQVLAEAKRVTRPEGFFGLVDSIQKGDIPELNLGLEKFPVDFHEPFYRNYSLNPLEALLEQSGWQVQDSDLGFFSKALLAKKAANPS